MNKLNFNFTLLQAAYIKQPNATLPQLRRTLYDQYEVRGKGLCRVFDDGYFRLGRKKSIQVSADIKTDLDTPYASKCALPVGLIALGLFKPVFNSPAVCWLPASGLLPTDCSIRLLFCCPGDSIWI